MQCKHLRQRDLAKQTAFEFLLRQALSLGHFEEHPPYNPTMSECSYLMDVAAFRWLHLPYYQCQIGA